MELAATRHFTAAIWAIMIASATPEAEIADMDLMLSASDAELAAARPYFAAECNRALCCVPSPKQNSQSKETVMPVHRSKRAALAGLVTSLALAAITVMPGDAARSATPEDGIVRVKSAYGVDETITRLKADIAAKGIMFFTAVDQSKLAADAGIKLNASTLLIFGNPPLGTQFITANPNAGLDWPVRLLVTQDTNGAVWTVYTDFQWIARRHAITDRGPQFKMASDVIASITSSVAAK